MIKGCQKRMIFIKDTGSDLFDEAYFVLKSDIPSQDDFENDIIKTATAIVNQNQFRRKRKPLKISKSVLLFLLGMLIGALISSFIFLLIL